MASEDIQKSSKKIIIICVCVVLFVIVGAVTAILLVLNRDQGRDIEPGGYTLDENNYQQIIEEMDAKVDAGYFETYMNTQWTFETGTSETKDAILGNSPSNTKPIRCEVLLNDTGEKIFSTGVIPVGVQIPAFKLEKDLDAGSYEAVCTIYLMDENSDGSYSDASSAGFYITIIVEN